MAKIHQLSIDTANKIAAGEVVERPASVIKELVENSIDAHATQINVDIIEGGSVLMKVSDNGEGMSQEDAQLCFSRHATSKIVDEHDLFNITTLGFRGEAIPSIASISHFTLETSEGASGYRIIYEYGQLKKQETCALNKGTSITVEKIFQNVPARLKYLKSVNAEFSAIYVLIEKLSLGHPEIAFCLTHNNRTIFQTNGSNKVLEVVADIYGLAVAKNMVYFEGENEEFHISGYTSNQTISRSSKNHIITLVNHRYVKNTKTINTINEFYRRYLVDKRYPITLINIEVDPYLVDVNVHPRKMEVRFSQEMALQSLITQVLEEAFTIKEEVVEEVKEVPIEEIKPVHESVQMSFQLEEDVPSLIKKTEPLKEEKQIEESISLIKEPEVTYEISQPVKPLKEKIYVKGQLRGTYIMGENEKGICLIHQSYASSRIQYEKYKKYYEDKQLEITPLLVPIMIELTESDFYRIEEKKFLLKAIGIELEAISKNTYCVRELPVWMKEIDEKIFIEDMIHELLDNESMDLLSLRDEAIITLANKSTIKSNTFLSSIQMQSLVDDLMRCDYPYISAHGKATMITYSDYELDKLFKR